MGKNEKLIPKILSGKSDSNVKFDDLRRLLKGLGFEKRVKGSHHIFRRLDIEEKPNLQRDGSNAKPYQVKQIRDIIVRHGLAE